MESASASAPVSLLALDPAQAAARFTELGLKPFHAKIARKDYIVGLNLTGSGVDDPDQQFFENYACGSQRNYTNYCNPELDALVIKQSSEKDLAARKKMVWEIDRRLQEDLARPIIMHNRGGTCWTPKVKNLNMMVNSIYNGFRMEDVWLEK